jgi:DNA-directed RNA polymerase specialized sigma subunit
MHPPEGIDPDQIFFHEAKIRDLILAYQRERTAETWQAIVIGCLPLIDSLIRQRNFQVYEDKDTHRSECIIKLFKATQHFNPARGRALSCLSVATSRFLISSVQTIRNRAKRMVLFEDKILEQYQASGSARTELPG